MMLVFLKNSLEVCSGVAKLGHTGACALATEGCAPLMQALLKLSVPNVPLSITNWALKVEKGVKIELHSIAICIFRITRSHMLPWSQCIRVCCKYYSDLTLCTQVCSEGMVIVLQFKATVWSKVAPDWARKLKNFKNFLGEHPPDPPSCFCISGWKLGGAWVRSYLQT